MNINKNSWHYKVWNWTHVGVDRSTPVSSNLCDYVQRIFWVSLWLMIKYTIATPFALLFGYLPINVLTDYWKWLPYQGLKVWGQFRAYPWMVVAPVLAVFLEYKWFHYYRNIFLIVHAEVCILLAVVALVLWIIFLSQKSTLLSQWVAAKKQGVCPLIRFKE